MKESEPGGSNYCRRVQFIGGEPTLFKGLSALIRHAGNLNFEFIEVFTNATHISDELFETIQVFCVNIATSFYSDIPEIHDSITLQIGSHAKTVKTIQRLLEANVPLRAGVIVMEKNKDRVEPTIQFLNKLGVQRVGIDRVRGVGRAKQKNDDLQELCGNCWRGSLVVDSNGEVAPCIMSKHWGVGSVRNRPLGDFVTGNDLKQIRRSIYEDVWLKKEKSFNGLHREDTIDGCFPQACNPLCAPTCSPSCDPCFPSSHCNPEIFDLGSKAVKSSVELHVEKF